MGLFEKKKKDAERCPICGKEISFFSGLVIADGTICDDCEKMVRGQFNIDKDNLTSYETMSDFASKMGISLTVMNNGEHWFHTDEQMNFLDDWICESNR